MIKTAIQTFIACLLVLAGCGALDVTDPTRIEEDDVANPTGAQMMRAMALSQAYRAVQETAFYGGMLSDEFFADLMPFLGQIDAVEIADRRQSEELEISWSGSSLNPYNSVANARFKAAAAIPLLRTYAPVDIRDGQLGQMFSLRALADILLAESFCPGVPLNETVDSRVVAGAPLTTAQVFEAALTELDSAATYAAGTEDILNFARVLRGRALLGVGRFAEAAEAVRDVPTDWVTEAEYDATTVVSNGLSFFTNFTPAYSVADVEGGNGLDFVSADDPRVEVVAQKNARDGTTMMYAAAKYPTRSAPVVIASGIEARLIEAEAALSASDVTWLAVLDELRATQIVPALPPLADPGTDDERVDLLFRERAFWLYATGHRLGDLRRLITQYGRMGDDVFPWGAYRLGDVYGSGTTLPILGELERRHNPQVSGCTSW